MKKSVFLFFLTICSLIFIVGCTNINTAEEALKNVGIEADEIYYAENYNYMEVLFYKDKKSHHLTAGVFSINDTGNREFIKYADLNKLPIDNEKISFGSTFGNKSLNEPEFTFQYGVINDSQIEKVKLYMVGNPDIVDRSIYAKVADVGGLRIWYAFVDTVAFYNIYEGLGSNDEVIYSSNPAFTNINSLNNNSTTDNEDVPPITNTTKEYLTGEIITDGLYNIYSSGFSTFCFIPDKESLELMKEEHGEKSNFLLAYDNLDTVKNLPKELGIYKVKVKIEKVHDYGYLYIDTIELTEDIETVIYEGKTFETNDIDDTVKIKDKVDGLIVDYLIKTDTGGLAVGFAGEIEVEGFYTVNPMYNEVFECKTGHIYLDDTYKEKLPTIYGNANSFYGWFSDINESFTELENHSLFGRGKFKTTGYYLIHDYGIGAGPGTIITEIISLDENYKDIFPYKENADVKINVTTDEFTIVTLTTYGDNYEQLSMDYYYINSNNPEKIFMFSSDRYGYTVSELKNEYEFTLLTNGFNMTTGNEEKPHSIICTITEQGAVIEKVTDEN